MSALRIKGIERQDSKGHKVGEAELWTYSLPLTGLYIAVTNENGAGRTASQLRLTQEQASELALYLRGLGY